MSGRARGGRGGDVFYARDADANGPGWNRTDSVQFPAINLIMAPSIPQAGRAFCGGGYVWHLCDQVDVDVGVGVGAAASTSRRKQRDECAQVTVARLTMMIDVF